MHGSPLVLAHRKECHPPLPPGSRAGRLPPAATGSHPSPDTGSCARRPPPSAAEPTRARGRPPPATGSCARRPRAGPSAAAGSRARPRAGPRPPPAAAWCRSLWRHCAAAAARRAARRGLGRPVMVAASRRAGGGAAAFRRRLRASERKKGMGRRGSSPWVRLKEGCARAIEMADGGGENVLDGRRASVRRFDDSSPVWVRPQWGRDGARSLAALPSYRLVLLSSVSV
ncbi:hypothetical protein PVAP13_9NG767577 [Panicum virgatum]|uniref:Uncharacterized protein n=1 Tax=Panicum virgatum TaxID=38727 RepID=A0A8T0N3N7_PANVG|nr:hypothetical protein PVAP13_9NG767577 [Panicum virgatum]